ncbi:hypothetical protein QLQ12_17425 [Actinoplanes sp. NEAU-A12]|uniref:Uncharacterized protein n=1 Tax=Actinoplanes sandaracinus TaxID=3045177 RepID=A0ABT6WKX6_9ACTN|nr:hypothetical protein [Actinoplanes sandaracinus]MDI6100391.1 hypothetical protein [Actinoplanes sandaracinus]
MSKSPEPADQRADDDPEFLAWRAQLPSFEMDGERLYLPTGDVPMDEEQIRQMWNRRQP